MGSGIGGGVVRRLGQCLGAPCPVHFLYNCKTLGIVSHALANMRDCLRSSALDAIVKHREAMLAATKGRKNLWPYVGQLLTLTQLEHIYAACYLISKEVTH
jgi:hypothetical protein